VLELGQPGGGDDEESAPSCLRFAVATRWPCLERLVLSCRTLKLADLDPVLTGEAIPNVRQLGLRDCEFADALCGVLPGSRVASQLRTLDLSRGMMTDRGARTLARLADSLRALEVLDATSNYLSPDGVQMLQRRFRRVVSGEQLRMVPCIPGSIPVEEYLSERGYLCERGEDD